MAKHRYSKLIAACSMIYFSLLTAAATLHAEDLQSSPAPQQPIDNDNEIVRALSMPDNETHPERSVFIKIPDILDELERPPVLFPHDRHALALESKGCQECHPRDKENKFIFTFPKNRDETSRTGIINAFHDACIACHTEQAAADKKTGPQTCGECHEIKKEYVTKEYLPVMPEYYEPLRDTHHRECLNCHREPALKAEDAGSLDWKNFYIKQNKAYETEFPEVSFDYYLHDKHDKALEQKCELCHYLSPKAKKKLRSEGKEPACRDWLREIDEKASLTERETAHPICLNCHLERKEEKKDTGPFNCKDCHTGITRTAESMRDIPRAKCEQEETILVQFKKDARMKGAAFDHKGHQESTQSCQQCHHDTLRACKECHTPEGSEEGDFVTLSEAYHTDDSPWSCIGCHAQEKAQPDCAGCHHLINSSQSDTACRTCHSGSLDSLTTAKKLPDPQALYPEDLEPELKINSIEETYQQADFPHDKIVKALVKISDDNSLARYFHTKPTTVCAGCHHFGPLEAKTKPARCRDCHTARKEPIQAPPALLGAYHQQCLGCHKQMDLPEKQAPQECEGCHAEKKKDS
ncbi:MAG: cytochrome c3 family protein [Deltaproteobacteria bacterium]|nr:cytochrome c3 family protein [Deltaproteobacteria bacterium]